MAEPALLAVSAVGFDEENVERMIEAVSRTFWRCRASCMVTRAAGRAVSRPRGGRYWGRGESRIYLEKSILLYLVLTLGVDRRDSLSENRWFWKSKAQGSLLVDDGMLVAT